MRVAILDPPGLTPPYDPHLASSLARRGFDVDLLTAPAAPGPAPEPDGYRRHETFLPLSARLPRSRARLAVKALEYVPTVWRSLRRLDRLAPDLVHVQWLA